MGIVNFSPIQEGAGDPSPTNVRPIHPGLVLKSRNLLSHDGWTVGKTYQYVKFIDTAQECIMSFTVKDSSIDVSDLYIGFAINEATSAATLNNGYRWCMEKGSIKSVKANTVYYPSTTAGQLCSYCVVYPPTQDAFDRLFAAYDIQIELGSTSSEYEPYYDMEIYGGYVDFENGEVVEEWYDFVIDGVNYCPVTSRNLNNEGCAIAYNIIGDRGFSGLPYGDGSKSLQVKADRMPNSYSSWQSLNKDCIQCGVTGGHLYIRVAILSSELDDVSSSSAIETSMRTWLQDNPIQISYPLETPTTYTLTASQLTQAYNQLVPVSPIMLERRRRMMLTSELLIPPEYQLYDYLQCLGSDAKIDTGVYGNDNTLEFDFTYMPLDKQNYNGHFGNYDGEDKLCWRVIQSTSNSPRGYLYTTGLRRAGVSNGIIVTNDDTESIIGLKTNFHLSYGRIDTICEDGHIAGSDQVATPEYEASENNISIGTIKIAYTGGTVRARFYKSFKIWSHGILIRDYRPCVRKSDNKAGFYDMVNHTFNPSIGTVDFIAGND